MGSLMNDAIFKPAGNNTFEQAYAEARRNPKEFEEYVRQTNPAAYNRALSVMNCNNPRALIMQMAQMRGIDLSLINRLGRM